MRPLVDHSTSQVSATTQGLRCGGAGFSLVEILVVLAIIAMLVAMLMPALSKARTQGLSVQCRSNLRQIGVELRIYADSNRGWWYPPMLGTNMPPAQRWGAHVFKPADAHPKIMRCPADLQPVEDHSYILNDHLFEHSIKGHSTKTAMGDLTPAQVILVGEKVSSETDYYMSRDEFDRVVEKYRHGIVLGSNYLYLDCHVDSVAPKEAVAAIDPWDVPAGPNP